MQHTLSIIQQIETEKKATHRAPTHATEAEVRARDASAAKRLDEMERCGMIRMGHTLNSRWIVVCNS